MNYIGQLSKVKLRRTPNIIVVIYSSYLNAQGRDIACVRCSFGGTRRNYVVVMVMVVVVVVMSRPVQDFTSVTRPSATTTPELLDV